jgi:hypothetical protein
MHPVPKELLRSVRRTICWLALGDFLSVLYFFRNTPSAQILLVPNSCQPVGLLKYGAQLAWLLVLFLVPVTFMLHNFWAVKDPAAQGMQMAMFLKNFSMLGGTLFHASRNWPVEPRFPPGPAR